MKIPRPSLSFSDQVPTGDDDPPRRPFAPLELVTTKQSCPPGCVAHNNAPLLGALDIGLKVASDAIPHSNEGEIPSIEDIPMLGSQLEEALGEAVVVPLLLDCIIEGRVAKIFFTIGN